MAHLGLILAVVALTGEKTRTVLRTRIRKLRPKVALFGSRAVFRDWREVMEDAGRRGGMVVSSDSGIVLQFLDVPDSFEAQRSPWRNSRDCSQDRSRQPIGDLPLGFCPPPA